MATPLIGDHVWSIWMFSDRIQECAECARDMATFWKYLNAAGLVGESFPPCRLGGSSAIISARERRDLTSGPRYVQPAES
jgi:hypothetical protein